MIKDRALKFKLLKYFVSRKWYPQVEVQVFNREGASSTPKLITDVDVLALYPDIDGYLTPFLGDCKTLKGQSPIARALWLRGLMDFSGGKKGIVLLERPIENDHKLAATEMGVSLLSNIEFDTYAKCTSSAFASINSALCVPEAWEEYFNLFKNFPKLKPIQNLGNNDFWSYDSPSVRLRQTITTLRSCKPELNPAHATHIAVVADICSFFAVAFNMVVCKIFYQYLHPSNKEQLDRGLKAILWGGNENYNFYNRLRQKVVGAEGEDLALPCWNTYMELVRTCLERPIATSICPNILKELAFEQFIGAEWSSTYIEELIRSDPYAFTFSLRIVDYVCKAAALPPEFQKTIEELLIAHQSKSIIA